MLKNIGYIIKLIRIDYNSSLNFKSNCALPIMKHYHNDGKGRDTFISFNSGGNEVFYFKLAWI